MSMADGQKATWPLEWVLNFFGMPLAEAACRTQKSCENVSIRCDACEHAFFFVSCLKGGGNAVAKRSCGRLLAIY